MEVKRIYLHAYYLLMLFLPTNLGSSESTNTNEFLKYKNLRHFDNIVDENKFDIKENYNSNNNRGSGSGGGGGGNGGNSGSNNENNNYNTAGGGANSGTIHHESLDSRPYFDMSVSKNVTALVGKTAYLNCRVHNLGNKTVSWIRHKDIHLLTTGRNTYSSDQRFQSVHNPQTEDWTLQVKYPQRRDSGIYECQISTTPPIGHAMYLSVVEPLTTIVGGPDLYINTGSTVNLTCIVRHLPEPPPSIIWTHNNEEISYDSPRGGVSVITEKGEITISNLLIQKARSSDSGKYSCLPSTANPETINVHILNGEHPEAMQHGGQLKLGDPLYILFFSILSIIIGR